MSTLHLISSPGGLTAALEVAGPDDALLLVGNAAVLSDQAGERSVSVLEEDLPEGWDLPEHATGIDYAGFVTLVAARQPVVTWR